MNVISKEQRGRLARLISQLQDSPTTADEIISREGNHLTVTKAHIVGASGVAGVGKSTLIGRMIPILRKDGLCVVVLAIDPTSDVSNGALLGDRIRMRDSYMDDGVFIRSLATRGAPDALTVALPAIVKVSSNFCDVVLVETAGAGQVDVAIYKFVDTFISILAPLGDAITLMKSGQTEHAHIVAVNVRKGLPENEQFVEQTRVLLGNDMLQDGWSRKVFSVDAKNGDGIEQLVYEGILSHRDYLKKSDTSS
ncbi:MAG: methylmalonyl Co-A mutase-associated GTPase MeaB [Chloroflexi bacterium]|nr:methylmalonyl Co-A mutase-associated GTPase MeaB [Chloroflexota bacterium]